MEIKPTQEEVDEIRKFKINSITAQLQLDLPDSSREERSKYVELLEIFLEEYMLDDLVINGGEQTFINFIDKYAGKLIAWKSGGAK